MIKYIIGNPRQYRADCGKGKITINGEKTVEHFTFQPIAWRFFSACLWSDLASGLVRNWVELFFVDENNCLSCICFHGYSRENILKMQTLLFYEDIALQDVEIGVRFEKRTKKTGGETYYIAEFSYATKTKRNEEEKKEATNFAKKNKIYRTDSITENEVIQAKLNYREQEQKQEKLN